MNAQLPSSGGGDDDFVALQRLWQASLPDEAHRLNKEIIARELAAMQRNEETAKDKRTLAQRSFLYQRSFIMTTLMAMLQDREQFIGGLLKGKGLGTTAAALGAVSALSLFVYGFVLGAQHSILQAFSSAVKLPLLFLLTILITFPTLFIFGSLIGIKRTLMQTLSILLAGTSIISLALVALSPVTLLFGMTTSSYAFFKLLNVCMFIVAWFLGAAFFRAIYAPPVRSGQQMAARGADDEEQDDDDEASAQYSLLSAEEAENHTKVQSYFIRFWFLLYGFVAVQIAWMLRPFVCSSSLEFELLRGMRDNVYGDILYSIAHILGLR